MFRPALILLALAAAPAVAAPPAAKSCVVLRNIDHQRILDDHSVAMQVSGQWYRNDLPSCRLLNRNRAFTTRLSTGQLCEGDLVGIFEPVSRMEFGSCALGPFTPIDAPPR